MTIQIHSTNIKSFHPYHGKTNNPLDKIKDKDKSKYIVRYGSESFRADNEDAIEKMTKKGILPDEVVSIDGTEYYDLNGICV